METEKAYFARKADELRLLNDCLSRPLPLSDSQSVTEVIRQKFQLTAALKAEHTLGHWTDTETAWAAVPHRSGPFQFTYDYQRADLNVRGPSFYDLEGLGNTETVYTGSGMAAIAALLLASAKLVDRGTIQIPRGSYGETQELIEGYARQMHVTTNWSDLHGAVNEACRIEWVDSSLPAHSFEAALKENQPKPDLVIFDTTCFSANSNRIHRLVNWARCLDIPLILVRSHSKLDSLGAEYGRLGSAIFIGWGKAFMSYSQLKDLPAETRSAIRLLGGAALPAHFPPYVGRPKYRELTSRRIAAILRNSRRARRCLAANLPGLTAELRYAHGLYVTLRSTEMLSEETARQAAVSMSEDLGRRGFLIRHAGSFGFDFAATEWFRDRITNEYVIRIAVPDLPTALWDRLTDEITKWWLAHERRGGSRTANIRQGVRKIGLNIASAGLKKFLLGDRL